MLTYLRYGLAIVCFAASAACFAVWGWNVARRQFDTANLTVASKTLSTQTVEGIIAVQFEVANPGARLWQASSHEITDIAPFEDIIRQQGRFGAIGSSLFFPLWYPALIFAFAGVAALRLGRRFTLRSALIATAIVAGLLGMAVAL